MLPQYLHTKLYSKSQTGNTTMGFLARLDPPEALDDPGDPLLPAVGGEDVHDTKEVPAHGTWPRGEGGPHLISGPSTICTAFSMSVRFLQRKVAGVGMGGTWCGGRRPPGPRTPAGRSRRPPRRCGAGPPPGGGGWQQVGSSGEGVGSPGRCL